MISLCLMGSVILVMQVFPRVRHDAVDFIIILSRVACVVLLSTFIRRPNILLLPVRCTYLYGPGRSSIINLAFVMSFFYSSMVTFPRCIRGGSYFRQLFYRGVVYHIRSQLSGLLDMYRQKKKVYYQRYLFSP